MSQSEQGGAELEALRQMVVAWKEGYSGLAESSDDGSFYAGELMLEVEEVVYPYVSRLQESGYVETAEVATFMRFCERQAGELGARG